jgi:hypothetical protein
LSFDGSITAYRVRESTLLKIVESQTVDLISSIFDFFSHKGRSQLSGARAKLASPELARAKLASPELARAKLASPSRPQHSALAKAAAKAKTRNLNEVKGKRDAAFR